MIGIRRSFCRAVACTLAGPGLRIIRAPQEYFRWSALGAGAAVASGGGGNSLLVASGADVLLVDCKLTGLGSMLRRGAEAQGLAPTVVVNTHHHQDHTGGNLAFSGLEIHPQSRGIGRVASAARRLKSRFREGVPEGLAAQMAAMGEGSGSEASVHRDLARLAERIAGVDSQSLAANRGFGSEAELRVGSETVQLRHVGRAHTDNDAFVYLPGRDLVHTGDLLFHGMHPYIDVDAGARTDGWQVALEAIRATCGPSTRVVPGHGPLAGPEAVQTQFDYFEGLRASVVGAVEAGATRDRVLELRPSVYEGLPPARGVENLGIVYDEMTL